MRKTLLLLLLAALFGPLAPWPAAHAQEAKGTLMPRTPDLQPGTPPDFPRFYFSGQDEQAQLLGRYLWYHFTSRLGNMKVLFNQEYLLMADMWLAGATDKQRQAAIQQVHRQDLLAIELDPEGYVSTHQHYSHTNDWGWPFPLWAQSSNTPQGVRGLTAGWHFQPLDKVQFWIGDFMRSWGEQARPWVGETAVAGFELHDLQSKGIVDNAWQLTTTGPAATIDTPTSVTIDAFNAPFIQVRWSRSGEAPATVQPTLEWQREGDSDFSAERRVSFGSIPDPWGKDKMNHSIITLHRHPLWQGKIKRLRLCLAPGETGVELKIDSLFTAYDTRHTINNPIFIMASYWYYAWTGDTAFLGQQMNRMRTALRYMQTELGGLEFNHIRNPWPGHDGLPGYTKTAMNDEKAKIDHFNPGHGIGNCYWDIMPFGWDDFYATYQYYAATQMMAELEEAVRANPGWGVPLGALAMDPAKLREHAAKVKETANQLFWNNETGRFIGCIDKSGQRWDYGFTFANLDAIWYGLASPEHSQSIMDWMTGKRIVAGDTSTGADIYHWRFGPRATTRRNIDWYGQGWSAPETIPFGGQIQDGGGVLGFSFYDMWARLKILGPDDAWQRLTETMAWEKEVAAGGGYREYYKNGNHGSTLQGGGTAGGIGIDVEFFESSLLPCIATYGFIGLQPGPLGLKITPALPTALPEMGVSDVLYHGVPLDVKVAKDTITLQLKGRPAKEIKVLLEGNWTLDGKGQPAAQFTLSEPGVYQFKRQ